MKRIQAGLLALALAFSLSLPAAASGYQDVPAASALKGEVEKAVRYGLMNGYSADSFGYADSMTRAQFAAVLVRMMGWSTARASSPSFSDVPATHTWYAAIETAAVHDVADTGGAFRPGDSITRGEMAEMLVRTLGLKSAAAMAEQVYSLPFEDVSNRRGYITIAYQIGMTNGMTATTFGPDATATRGQAAAMLVRIYEKLHQKTSLVHGFYAISSYSQIGLAEDMSRVSLGWSRMTWDGGTAFLSTTSASGNEYAIPTGYSDAIDILEQSGVPLNLSVYMDVSGGLRELLASDAGRAQAVEQIVNELTVPYSALGRNPYDGVTIDFEGLRAAQKEDFTAFLTELEQRVHGLGKLLYVCVSPVLTTGSYYDGYDYRAIGQLADYVILMAHDYDPMDMSGYVGTEYYKTAAPAPIDQVYAALAAITDAQTGVASRNKVLLAFSSKPVAWRLDGGGRLASVAPAYPAVETVSARLTQADTVTGWSRAYQMPYAAYTAEGASYFLWYEDNASVTVKLNAAKLLGVTGVSLWRLGTIPTDDSWNWNSLLP